MVTFLVSVKLHVVGDHLLFCNVLEDQEVRLIFVVEIVALGTI